jgi:hypothetical protein
MHMLLPMGGDKREVKFWWRWVEILNACKGKYSYILGWRSILWNLLKNQIAKNA